MQGLITTEKNPKGRRQITALQREIWGLMIDAGIYSQNELARRAGVKPWTLSRAIRQRRANPELLKRLEEILKAKRGSLAKAA